MRVEGPEAKRAKVVLFKEILGSTVPEAVAMDCLNATRGDLERAINMYYNSVGSASNPIRLEEDGSSVGIQEAPQKVSRLVECFYLGSISCSGSLTTKLSASANELYMDKMLNCTFSIKPPPSTAGFPNTPPELLDILHGSGFVRFSLPGTRSEIGRLPAPLAAAIVPLVMLELAEVSLSVGFPGCAGLNMNPGASVPVRVDVALRPNAFKSSSTFASSADDLKNEKIHACWTIVLAAMDIAVSTGNNTVIDEDMTVAPSVSSDDNSPEDDESMTEEMSRLVAEYSKPDLPYLSPSDQNSFKSVLQPYQAQGVYWMLSREYPKELGGIPEYIRDRCLITNNSCEENRDSLAALPPAWTEIPASKGRKNIMYYHEGFFQTNRPPPQVECRGGILADEMGLGKTVMTLCVIALDKRPQTLNSMSQSLRGGTLVIVHLSLLRQWVKELERHCPFLTFAEFHGADRSFDPKSLASVDIVFSTYGTVAVNSDNGQSPLLKINWLRVVLDEAHSIRTRSTKTGKAVARLIAERRWCLSGTPLQNSIMDIYPLVAWLRVSPWKSFSFFKKEVVDKVDEGYVNAQRMLKPLMIRRTKATKGPDGKPLVELPPRRNKIVRIELSPEEKDFYRALFWKTKLEFDKFEKSNAVMFNITHVLQLIVRLRQALCHPILCRSALAMPEPLTEPQTNGVESLDDLLEKFLLAKSTTSGSEYYANAIEELKRIGIDNIECPICLAEPCQFPIMTPCGHTMCRKCAIGRLRGECPICRTIFTNGEIQNINHLSTVGENNNNIDTDLVCPPLSSKLRVLLDYLARDLKKGRRVIVFSQFVSFLEIVSKVLLAKRVPHRMLHGGHSPAQRESVVDWLTNADLSGEDKAYLSYLAENACTVSDTEDDHEANREDELQGRVVLVSLKAGGVGLNLVAANVVYLTDMWWNGAVEEQAFTRVHRIGQVKNVHTYKFVCEQTIDERILDLQATKSDMTTDVLGDRQVNVEPATDRNKAGRKLTLEDIRQLFKPEQGSFLT